MYAATHMYVKKFINGIYFLKEKPLAHADFPGHVEDSRKRAEFTTTQHHHYKLFLPAHLVTRDQPHEANSKEPNAVSRNTPGENKSSQRRKNSGKPDSGVKGIDNETLEELKKAGINPGTVAVAHQKMALKQYEAEQKQQLAKPNKNREMIEQRKRIQEAKDELKMRDWSGLDTSLSDVEKQKKILEKVTHDRKIQEEKVLMDEIIRLQEEEKIIKEAAVQQQREGVGRQKRLQEENRLHEVVTQQRKEEAAGQKKLQEEKYQREETARQEKLQEEHHKATQQKDEEAARQKMIQGEAAQQETWVIVQQNKNICKTHAANKYDDSDSLSEEYYDVPEALPDKQETSPANPVHVPDYTGSSDSSHIINQQQDNVVTTQPYSEQGYKHMWLRDPQPSRPNPKSSNDNPHNLEVGSMIRFGNPPCYGIIKWMGTLPETDCVMMAGVEVVSCT